MMRFTKSLLVVGAAMVLAVAAMGQGMGGPGGGPGRPGGPGRMGAGGPGGRMGDMNQEILSKLNLNASQKAKIKALDEKTMKSFQAMRKDFKPGQRPDPKAFEKMRTHMTKMRADYDASLKKILTAPQFKKYEALRKAKMDEMRKMFGGMRGGPGGPGMGGPGGPRR